jgi:DNA-binding SARP family transcriptional activator
MREIVLPAPSAGASPFEVRLLGGALVNRPGGEPVVFATRKALQLFLFLAATLPQRAPRARLAALLWSDRDEPQARGSLRQALTAIRRALGGATDALAVEGEAVRLEADRVWTDLDQLRRLTRSVTADADDIAALYRGPLLAGLAPSDPAFREWLDAERRAVEEATLLALRRAAARAEAAGDPAAALRAAHLALGSERCAPSARERGSACRSAAGRPWL